MRVRMSPASACAPASACQASAIPFGKVRILAVGRAGVDTGEHGLGTPEDFVVQDDANWRQVDAAVDGAGLPRRRLMDDMDVAIADAHTRKSRINSTKPQYEL